ncbi:malto-oligosyltrehalose synthase [Longitalea luteola]|uniref:malto-oligosyltrehalose synthase n=1 Tax=Longitalea luteola TaxID=2812563 RepID=UPI001A95C1BB|nr:malto-oligosyltrehalose synthase [Longitalea luteola]
MMIPVSTYRLQLNAAFAFKQVAELISYLQELGITTIYASPFFAAPAGSMHGYDVCDSHALNSEIGTLEQLQEIVTALRGNNMNWLQDVVPNHMVYGMTNQRLADVLERGVYSPYYKWFDIDWQHPDPSLHGKLMTPFLGKPFNECIEANELTIDICDGGFVVRYMDNRYPLSISAYESLLAVVRREQAAAEAEKLIQDLYGEAKMGWPLSSWREIKTSLIKPVLANEKQLAAVQQLLAVVNADTKLLQTILQQQYYQLTWWQDANQLINYRRFFAVNELIALNMSNEEVFHEYHHLLQNLYQQKLIHGLRIDHIDGLQDPGEYLNRLRQLLGDDCYIIVEKILEQQEQLPAAWPIQGTTGYEFTSQINWLLTNTQGAKEMVAYYRNLFPDMNDYKKIIFEKKQRFLEAYMGGEWYNLISLLYRLQLVPDTIQTDALKQALGLFMCCLPVYRLYPEGQPLDAVSKEILRETFEDAVQKEPALKEALDYLQSLWTIAENDADLNKRRLAFQKRLMQFTGPLTAKGVEDTTFYVYNALLGHNEVGDTPDKDHYSVNDFHQWILQRQQQHPWSLNATSTHDTKRGEDGRIRVNVLTWFTREWQQQVEQWRQLNSKHKITKDGQHLPSLHDEYFIYQSLIAGFPEDEQVTALYIERLQAYFIKSAREAKLYTNWQGPDEAYEEAGCLFIEKILSPEHDFVRSFLPFYKTIVRYAQLLSMTQVLVKITVPGVPDIYQGCELWNTSYVDPDNRRPVDFNEHKKHLQALKDQEKKGFKEALDYVTSNRNGGLEKLYVTWKALQCRRQMASLFLHGSYLPLNASAESGIIAYARQYEDQWALVIAPVSDRLLANIGEEQFTDVFLTLPANAPVQWTNVFTGETISVKNNLPLNAVFKSFPVALLTGETK